MRRLERGMAGHQFFHQRSLLHPLRLFTPTSPVMDSHVTSLQTFHQGTRVHSRLALARCCVYASGLHFVLSSTDLNRVPTCAFVAQDSKAASNFTMTGHPIQLPVWSCVSHHRFFFRHPLRNCLFAFAFSNPFSQKRLSVSQIKRVWFPILRLLVLLDFDDLNCLPVTRQASCMLVTRHAHGLLLLPFIDCVQSSLLVFNSSVPLLSFSLSFSSTTLQYQVLKAHPPHHHLILLCPRNRTFLKE